MPRRLVWSTFLHYATGQTGVVEIESNGQRSCAGIFLTLTMRAAQKSLAHAKLERGGPKPGECAARGLAQEIAFNTTDGSHLAFDEFLPLLDMWFMKEGLAL